jgi:probable F420-dependent oxidoreductase
MKIGFMLPMFGVMANHENMIKMAHFAEEKGFESVWSPDHIVMPTKIETPYPYTKSRDYIADPNGAHLEPFTSLAFIAGHTKRVRLGFTVLIAPYRNPIETAKQMASLDVLSNGRLIVGTGAGWLNEEFEALNISHERKWPRTDEYIRIWKELWTAEEPSFEGEFYNFADVRCLPQPIQKPHPPITIGGNGNSCFRRVVNLADGWQVVSEGPDFTYSKGGNLESSLQVLHKMSEESGRDPKTIEITVVVIAGTPEGVIRDIPRYEKLGVTRLILDFPSFVSDIDEMAGMLDIFASEVPLDSV